MARDHPQDKAGTPPEDRRCTAIVAGHQADAGRRCPQWTMKGRDVCKSHSERRHIPSHEPPEERRCQSKAQDENGHLTRPCPLWAMRGLTVCWRHGGANRTTRAAGERRVAEDKVMKKALALATRFDVIPVDNPLEALADHVGEEIRLKNALATIVAELEELRYRGAAGEQIRAEITLYERALDRVGTRLTAIARLNIDERLAAIQEKQAEVIIHAIDAALAHAGITGPAAAEAKRVAARHLRSVA